GRCVTPTSRAPPGACRRSPRLVFPGSRRQQPVSSPSDAHDRTFMGRRGGWLAGGGSRAGGVMAGWPVGWRGGRWGGSAAGVLAAGWAVWWLGGEAVRVGGLRRTQERPPERRH